MYSENVKPKWDLKMGGVKTVPVSVCFAKRHRTVTVMNTTS